MGPLHMIVFVGMCFITYFISGELFMCFIIYGISSLYQMSIRLRIKRRRI